ncbi:MAG: helix-turn-helix domain-containing protein [Calditrichia bacterium]
MPENEIMSIKDVAAYLQLNEQTVYRMVQQRKIPAIKLGGQWKVKRSHLDKMFDDILDQIVNEITPA